MHLLARAILALLLYAALLCTLPASASAQITTPAPTAPTAVPTLSPRLVYFPVRQQLSNITVAQFTSGGVNGPITQIFLSAVRNSLICCEAYTVCVHAGVVARGSYSPMLTQPPPPIGHYYGSEGQHRFQHAGLAHTSSSRIDRNSGTVRATGRSSSRSSSRDHNTPSSR